MVVGRNEVPIAVLCSTPREPVLRPDLQLQDRRAQRQAPAGAKRSGAPRAAGLPERARRYAAAGGRDRYAARRSSRYFAHRRRCAAAIRARPSDDFGPDESPPCRRQRSLPRLVSIAMHLHHVPRRVSALQKILLRIYLPVLAEAAHQSKSPCRARIVVRK